MGFSSWANGIGWRSTIAKQGRASEFDSLGGAIKILSSLLQKLTVENIEVLLAIGSLSQDSEWIELKKIKEKLPNLSAYQLTRNLNAITESSSIVSVFSKSPALIKLRQSKLSNREKEVSLTRLGTLLLHRSLQAFASGLGLDNNLNFRTKINNLLHLYVTGVTRTGEKVEIETSKLVTTGPNGYGKVEATLQLCGQAISQGATVYWMDLTGALSSCAWLYTVSEIQQRNNAFFVTGNVSEMYAQISVAEVLNKQGICFHRIDTSMSDNHNFNESSTKSLQLLTELAEAFESHSNVAGCLVVIDGFRSVERLCEKTNMQLFDRLINAGLKLHIIERGQEGLPETYDQLLAGGFDVATFGDESKDADIGEATVRCHFGIEKFFRFDYENIKPCSEIRPVNLRKN